VRHFPDAPALQAELARTDLVDPPELPVNVVTMNPTARVADDGSGRERIPNARRAHHASRIAHRA
jgi:hypothetical protein